MSEVLVNEQLDEKKKIFTCFYILRVSKSTDSYFYF